MSEGKPTYEELEARLEQLESAFAALRGGQVDTIVGAVEPLAVRAVSELEDRERFESRLRAEHANLLAFIDATPAAVFLVDAQEHVRRANPEADCLFGGFAKPTAGAQNRCGDLAKCVHRRDDPRGCGFGPSCPMCQVNQAIKRALGGEVVRNVEASLTVEKNGATLGRHFVLGAAPADVDGENGAALALQDVTESRNAQAEHERLRAALAQSDRLACMGTLAAGVAHEINNPLSYVLYNLESAVEDLPRFLDELRRCRDQMASHLSRAHVEGGATYEALDLGLVEDILSRLREAASGAHRIKDISRGLGTFSRIEEDDLGPVDVRPIIEHALAMAFNQIKYRARVVKDYGAIPQVLGTDGKLAQVVLNLLINAAHAIDEGHVEQNEIRIRTWAEAGSVFIEVSDTGKGIAPEHRSRIFEPFFTTKEIGSGTGLGLAISRNLINSFDGELSFSSEVGVGTRFLIELPRLPTDWESMPYPDEQREQGAPSLRGRVLVIDDEEAVRAAVARMLRREHEVVTAASGEEGKEILAKDRNFDLVLCDLMMPQVTGMELHAWLSEADPVLAHQVVFVTGGAFTPGASDYLAKVGNMRIEKPFDIVSFKRLVQVLIRAARSKKGEPVP